MNEYQKSYNCFLRGLNPKPDPAVFQKRNPMPYWIVYQKYSDGKSKVICATKTHLNAVIIGLNHVDRYIRLVGNLGVSIQEKSALAEVYHG
jgi:hypothetical protein